MVAEHLSRVGGMLLTPGMRFPAFASYDYTCNCASKFSLPFAYVMNYNIVSSLWSPFRKIWITQTLI